MAGVLVAPAQVGVQGAGLERVRVWTVWLRWFELTIVNCRGGPKWASIGFAQDAYVGVKHSSTPVSRVCRLPRRRPDVLVGGSGGADAVGGAT
ncbi:hypothetical protein GCM10018781_64170 [Kitasatospora indigofera]|uniref:Uncharacterized protein n=1 Tax=Kitasatospora indigofera TaxID=67307 RepID=A0A919GAZ4_9ACTN|nr:hypothetical protein GCM10018781_64170 [Kitasatospora indigofera]